MADMSKCIGTDCPLKESCYRYTAPESEIWQSWLSVVWYDKTTNKCELWWNNEGREESKSDNI